MEAGNAAWAHTDQDMITSDKQLDKQAAKRTESALIRHVQCGLKSNVHLKNCAEQVS